MIKFVPFQRQLFFEGPNDWMKMYDEDFFAYLNKEKQNKRQQSNISNGLCY